MPQEPYAEVHENIARLHQEVAALIAEGGQVTTEQVDQLREYNRQLLINGQYWIERFENGQ